MKRRHLAIAALLPLASCASWTVISGSTPDAITAANPAPVRLTTTMGTTVVLTAARVVGDSVTGFDPANGRITMPLSRIAHVEIHPGTPLNHWKLVRDTLVHVP